MKKQTDYNSIAFRYDNNPLRHRIDPDPEIRTLLDEGNDTIHILDLACGTGNYIVAQRKTYPTDRISWHGLDRSESMLDIARGKLPDTELIHGDVQVLPYDDDFFDLVVCRYAFHHFENKRAALDEAARTLRPGGVFVLRNICPERMSRSWVYQYFPKTLDIDADRFWDAYTIFDTLKEIGFNARIDIRCTMEDLRCDEVVAEAVNRDMSQLNLIDEGEYQEGLERLRRDCTTRNTPASELAELTVRAVRSTDG